MIAEFRKISEEVSESIVTVDDLDNDGNVIGQHEEIVRKVIPVMGFVYRETTAAENVEMQRFALVPQSAEPTYDEKLKALLDSIEVQKPMGTDGNHLPFKVGYRWEMVYNGNAFAWHTVVDPNAVGTADNPIYWVDDGTVPLIDNAYYMVDGVRKVYMSGQFVEF